MRLRHSLILEIHMLWWKAYQRPLYRAMEPWLVPAWPGKTGMYSPAKR